MKIGQTLISILVLIFITSCTGNKDTAPGKPVTKQTTAASITPPALQHLPADSFINFYNAEMVEYCVPIPSNYKEGYDAAAVKGIHMFFNPAKKENAITVMGLLRADTTITLSDYFKNTYDTIEEEGKAIEEKRLLPQQNCFYVKGYWNNMYYKARFLEITWLRKDEAVVYKAEMPVTDTAFWYKQLNRIIKSNTNCH